MKVDFRGTVLGVRPIAEIPTKSGNIFRKLEFVLEIENVQNPQYSDYYQIEVHGDAIEHLGSKFKKGDEVNVSCYLSGRKYEKNNKVYYFTTFKAVDIEVVGQTPTGRTPVTKTAPVAPVAPDFGDAGNDDLPF